MQRRNPLSLALVVLFCLLGLTAAIIAILPYGSLRPILDRLSRHGNLALLRPDNAFIFRFLIGILAFGMLGVAFLTGTQRWKLVADFCKQVWRDLGRLFPPLKRSRAEWGFLAALLVVTLFAIVRRLASIQGPMQHDESYTVVNFADTIFQAMTDYSLPNNHVLHTILVNLSVRLFGLAPWTVRLPAFVAGILLVPGIYFLARRVYDPWTGLTASLLVAFSGFMVSYSTNARGYTLVALFTLIILILGTRVRKEKNLAAWVAIGVFSALGLYTVPVMLFPFGILFVWLFLENLATDPAPYSSKWDFIRYWLAAGFLAAFLTLLLYTPILIYTGPQKLFANGFVAPLAWADLPDTWHARLVETWAEWTAGVPFAVILLLGAGWIASLVFHRKLSAQRVPMQAAALLWIPALLIAQRSNAWAKVWVFLLPLMLLWSAAGIVGLLKNVRLKSLGRLSAAGIVTGAAVLLGLWSTVELIPKLPGLLAQRGDVENSVLFFKDHIRPTDLIVVDWPDDASVWFYALEHGIQNVHFDKRIAYTQAWILVNPPDGQTIETVLTDRGPDRPALDLAAIRLVQKIGTRLIYECPIQ